MRCLAISLALILVFLALTPLVTGTLDNGVVPPAFSGVDTEGVPWSSADHVGAGPLVIEFIWTACPHCQATAPVLNRGFVEFGDRVAFVAVAADSRDDDLAVQSFDIIYSVAFPILVADRSLLTTYAIAHYPTTYFVDTDGTIMASHEGSFGSFAVLSPYLEDLVTFVSSGNAGEGDGTTDPVGGGGGAGTDVNASQDQDPIVVENRESGFAGFAGILVGVIILVAAVVILRRDQVGPAS